MDVVDDLDGMFQVVESDQSLDEQKEDLRRIERAVFVVRDPVKLLDRIVGDIAQGATEKWRDTRNHHRSIISHELFQRIEGHFAVEFSFFTIFDDFDLFASAFKNEPRPASQE